MSYQRARAVLADPAATPDALLTEAEDLYGGFERSEHLAGLLPGDAVVVLVQLYERAGAGGKAEAWRRLGELYRHGGPPYASIVEPDDERALGYFWRGAQTGDRAGAEAWIRAAHFSDGPAAERHRPAAAARLDELIDAEPDNTELLVLAGWMTYTGHGYAPDPMRARQLMSAAAARDDADAEFELYVYDMTGVAGAVNETVALTHLHRAADLGNPRAMANLGGLYATGNGVARDLSRSVEWYRRGADAGHAKAAFTLGAMYARGGDIPPDLDRATEYFDLAEALGYPVREALVSLGLLPADRDDARGDGTR